MKPKVKTMIKSGARPTQGASLKAEGNLKAAGSLPVEDNWTDKERERAKATV